MADSDVTILSTQNIPARKTTDITGEQAMNAIKGVAATGMSSDEIAYSVSNGNTVKSGRAAAMGDSITADGASSWFNQLCLGSNGLFRRAINAGVPGETSQEMLDRIIADIPLESMPDVVFVQAGTNDIGDGVDSSITLKNISSMLAYIYSIGASPVLCNIPPRDNFTSETLELRRGIFNLSELMRVSYVDAWSTFIDSSTGAYVSGASDDGIHPNSITANEAGIIALSQLTPITDTYEWDGLCRINGQIGALSDNDFFMDNGSGLPSGWGRYGSISTVDTSLDINEAPLTGNTMVLTVNSGETGYHAEEMGGISIIDMVEGDRFAVSAMVSVDGFESGVNCAIRANLSGAAAIGLDASIHYQREVSDCIVYGEGVVPASAGTITMQIQAKTTNDTASGEIRISNIEVWKVSALTSLT